MLNFAIMKNIKDILENDDDLESFMEVLYNAIEEDDEPWCKKARQLLLYAIDDEKSDDFFISICGFSLNSLLEMI